jgi:hypothetical protein
MWMPLKVVVVSAAFLAGAAGIACAKAAALRIPGV